MLHLYFHSTTTQCLLATPTETRREKPVFDCCWLLLLLLVFLAGLAGYKLYISPLCPRTRLPFGSEVNLTEHTVYAQPTFVYL